MLSKVILPFLIGAAGLVKASPVPESLTKRTCGSLSFPNQLVQLSQANPDTSYPNTWQTDSSVSISQSVDGSGNKINQFWELISFPPQATGDYGCELHLEFPSDYTPNISGASPTLNIYTVQTPLASSPTFNNVDVNEALFGTVTVQAGQSVVVNSETCNGGSGQGLAFVFRYADWVGGAASVGWTQYVNLLNGAGVRGAYLRYNC